MDTPSTFFVTAESKGVRETDFVTADSKGVSKADFVSADSNELSVRENRAENVVRRFHNEV